MMHQRIFAAAFATSFCLTLTPAVVAQTVEDNSLGASHVQTTDDIIDELRAMDANKLCAGKEGRLRGKCITDVIKRLKTMRDEYADATEIERTEWYNEHSYLGVSAEYTKQLNAYLKLVKDKLKTLNDLQRALEKAFFAEQKTVRTGAAASSSSSSRTYTRTIKKTEMSEASLKCVKQKDDTAKRICLRLQLRLTDPNARIMGAGQKTQRSQ